MDPACLPDPIAERRFWAESPERSELQKKSMSLPRLRIFSSSANRLRLLTMRPSPLVFITPPFHPNVYYTTPTRQSSLFLRACLSVAAQPPETNSRPRSPTRNRTVVKKKVALLIGYDGANYHGIQKNSGVETVSDALERALHAAGAISDDNFGSLEKIKWQAAARTDRGVSAVGNLVSAKLQLRREEVEAGHAFTRTVERVNAALPLDVVLFGVKNVTNSFSARSSCGERWYEYMLPMSALHGAASPERFCQVLKRFEGSHWFHNYTVGVNHSIPPPPQAQRCIRMARCDLDPLFLQGPPEDLAFKDGWVRVQVRGQSFLLHQIRKMVSLALLTVNGHVPEDSIQRSFDTKTLINVPPAPAEGLFLDSCHFDWYNERHKMFLKEAVTMSDYDTPREKFKHEYIMPSVARRFASEQPLLKYLYTIQAHPVTFPSNSSYRIGHMQR